MEDVISHMAGYVPLKAIAERILAAYARDPFGDFKVVLFCLGPFACFSSSIVQRLLLQGRRVGTKLTQNEGNVASLDGPVTHPQPICMLIF